MGWFKSTKGKRATKYSREAKNGTAVKFEPLNNKQRAWRMGWEVGYYETLANDPKDGFSKEERRAYENGIKAGKNKKK